ncbi:predicted protein [Botrytis cinerea T4]|uniref:Uncharacterized protein n=1 Tax=Botryotinia fuckeliana (strain T4) TaxID=999810 RepID=G2YX66_BOTF4|nr:predicted protein [Botrytis cinerea T4]
MLDIESSTEQAHASRKVVWSDYLRVTGIISDAATHDRKDSFRAAQHWLQLLSQPRCCLCLGVKIYVI